MPGQIARKLLINDEQVETAKRIQALKRAIEDLEEQLGTDLGR